MSSDNHSKRLFSARVRSVVKWCARTVHILFLTLLWVIYELICRLRPVRQAGLSKQVPHVDALEANLAELMREGRPVIIEGLVEKLGLQESLSLESLREMAANVNEKFPVKKFESHSPFFLYTGDYGRKLDHTAEMSLTEFLRSMFDEEGSGGPAVYQLFGQRALEGKVRALINQISQSLAGVTENAPEAAASGLWIGSKGVVTPLHFDCWQGLLFQLHGSKKVSMYAPEDGSNLYLTSPFSVGNRFSILPGRSREADPTRFSRMNRATRYDACLKSGDVLYIPPFWLHEIEALEANISIPFRFKLRVRDYIDPRSLRAMCEGYYRHYFASQPVSK
jgi:hypothetical protein